MAILVGHAFAVPAFGVLKGASLGAATLAFGIILLPALLAVVSAMPRKLRAASASAGLVLSSAAIVHFSGGYIEAHFHFFIALGVIFLYEDWTASLLTVLFVLFHHGIVGTLWPDSVYNHPAAQDSPWLWALLHAGLVVAAAAGNLVAWGLVHQARTHARLVLDAAGEAFLGVDRRGRITFANPAAGTLTGYPPSGLVGLPVANVLPVAAGHAGARRGPAAGALLQKDGSIRQVEWIASPLDGGSVLSIRDVTDLRRSQRDLADLSESRAIGLQWLGPDGTVLWANRAECEPLGYAREEYIGRSILDIHEDRAAAEDFLARIRRGERVMEYEARLRAKDGSVRHSLVTASPLFEGGKLVHCRCFSKDITDRRRAEEELALARRQVATSEKMSALGSLVSGVAHEIRTPLTYTANSLHLLNIRVARAAASDDAQEVRTILRELPGQTREALDGVLRINRLVEDLRRFTKLPSDQRTAVSLSDPVREAVDLFRATHRGGPRLDVRLNATPRLLLDRAQIQQVVLNLLDNAAEASPPKAVIRVSTRSSGRGGELVIEDQGAGIDPQIRERIFDPFFTTKAEGTGLGLSIVQKIVLSHGGTIRCDSAVGKGTVFRVRFPQRPPARSNPPLEARPPASPTASDAPLQAPAGRS